MAPFCYTCTMLYHLLHDLLSVLWCFATFTSFIAVKDEGTAGETTKIIHGVCFGHSSFPHMGFVQKIREQNHGTICRNAELIKLFPSL